MSTLTVATISNGTISTATANVINGAKAWVNFNGTGTVAIRASYNVSSITDNGTGDYTVNFTTALTDGNYSACIATNSNSLGNTSSVGLISAASAAGSPSLMSATQLRIFTGNSSAGGATDFGTVCVSIFR